MPHSTGTLLIIGAVVASAASFAYFGNGIFPVAYDTASPMATGTISDGINAPSKEDKPTFIVTHVKIPEPLKGIYMTACVAATPSFRAKLVKLIDETELNSVIIDVKDYTGTIAFPTDNTKLADVRGTGCVVPDMKEFIGLLHKKEIYVIARITVFQDPTYVKMHPELAVKRASDGTVWKDHKGLSFIDVGAKPFWEYITALGEESYAIGFDELNFDYIRFPSDGNMKDIYYSWSEKEILADADMGKAKVLRNFFSYLYEHLSTTGVALSADLFGMTTTNTDDLNIGQVLEYAAPYFDYIMPMVYPSHYPPNFNGWKNPNTVPYEIVKFSMDAAAKRLVAASTTPNKLRPWLQDFDYPVPYTPGMVRTQIQATYDAGLMSWILWDAGNTYTRGALRAE